MLMLKKTIAALSLLSILAACQNDENPSQPEPKPRQDINLTRAEQEFMDKGTDFAFRFFDQVCSTEKEKPNVFVSPLSASLCLSMITNGATDNTLAEMQDVLGFPANTFSLDDLNNYNQKLTSALLDLDNTTQLGIANSIWIEEGFKVYDSFVDVNKKMYDAQVQELDFTSPTAKDMINQWCATQTNNCIKEVIQEIPAEVRMYLINALYFKGIWKSQFDKSATGHDNFTNVDGSQQKVAMMNQTATFNYTQTDDFSIAELPYGNEAFSMVILLPSGDKTLNESLPSLNYENWKQWSKNMVRKEAILFYFLNKEKKHHRKSDFYIMKSHPINQRRKSVINIAKEKMQSKKRICKCLLPNSIYRFLFILFLQNEHVLYFSNAFINSFFTVSTPGKPVCF